MLSAVCCDDWPFSHLTISLPEDVPEPIGLGHQVGPVEAAARSALLAMSAIFLVVSLG